MFRDIAKKVGQQDIYKMLLFLPEKISRKELFERLPEQRNWLELKFANHKDPGYYDLRGVTLFGITTLVRLLQPESVKSPIHPILLGMVMLVRPLKP